MEKLAKIRRPHLREGVPIKEIERRTGIARNTIKNWLRKGQMVEPKYPPRLMATKLEVVHLSAGSGDAVRSRGCCQ